MPKSACWSRCASVFLLVVATAALSHAQTYELGGPSQKTPTPARPGKPPVASQPSLGWGSNIQDARLARAAELALKQGKRGEAVVFAQRAAQASPNDPQLWILLGYAARLNGQLGLSSEAYSRGLRLKPGSPDAMSGLAQTDNLMGRTDEAQRLLRQVLAADPGRVDDALLLGEMILKGGNPSGAIEYFRRAEGKQPSTRAEVLLAIAYQRMKQFDQANHYLDLARKRAPGNPDVERSLAGFYIETGNYPDAITALQAIRNPRPDVLAELAYVNQLTGRLTEAARLYSKAADGDPKDLGLQLSAAQAHVAAGSIDKAGPYLTRAERLDPEYYRLHAIRGEIARLEDRLPDAVREYRKVITVLPASPAEGPLYGIQIHMDLAELYQSLKQTAASREQLDIAHTQIGALDEQGPARPPFLRLRSSIELHLGDLDRAKKDVDEALALNPKDPAALQLDGDLLVKQGHPDQALLAYNRILDIDPKNRFALISLGYASRAAGRDQDAEKYFRRLADTYPNFYVPYLALGDLYTARRDFARAEANYTHAYQLAPKNALIIAGGMNAGIEAHTLDVAGTWAGRVTPEMRDEPQVLREEERYLAFRGDYTQSAERGEQAMKDLPKDRDVAVYLGYDYLNLKRYDDLLRLTARYNDVLPKEPDIPLLAGYVHKHNGELETARQDFSEALDRDPDIVTAYVNRGYVLHDLGQPGPAEADFEAAIKREPNNGEAHLGLAYTDLDLKRPQLAIKQSQLAEQALGDSEALHLIRGTAWGQRHQLTKAATEYRLALKFNPDDATVHSALAGVLFSARNYRDAITELNIAQKNNPTDANTYALLARSYAELGDREQTMRNVELAERYAPSLPKKAHQEVSGEAGVYLSTGAALTRIGDENGALERYRKALLLPTSDRVGVRLAIAHLLVDQGHGEEARRQIALGLMEAEAGETVPASGEQLIEVADLFRSLHDYQLSQDYLDRAQSVGAPEASVRLGRANNYIALGDTARAQGELASISREAGSDPDYQFLLTQANVYRQQHENAQALTAFAQAADAAGEDQTAEQNLLAAGADEGLRVTPRVSLLSDFAVSGIFEDTTVYVLDSKLDALTPVPITDTALLPSPRSSLQTAGTAAYHLHLGALPTASGFFQVRNARGQIFVPATNSITNRNTTDYSFNFGLNPTVHFGRNVVTFNSGVQATIRRDAITPKALNQNLFRIFTYASTSSFFNAVSASGYVLRESGPFTDLNLHSRALVGAIDFRVGAPWGKTSLITGWAANDQKFDPQRFENYYTASYIGLNRRFGSTVNVRAVVEDLRAWRKVDTRSGIAQALRPAGVVDFSPARSWRVQVSSAWNNTRGFHVYDAIQNGAAVSYAMPFRREFNDQGREVPLAYPIRFSAGLEEETFYNFSGPHATQLRPYFSISLF